MKYLIVSSVAAAALVAGQTPSPSPSTPTIATKSAVTQKLTLGGCITPDLTPADPFMLSNPFIVGEGDASADASATTADAGTAASVAKGYRLTGSDVSPHAGKRVQIVGGLMPSANAAGAAGAASSGVIGPTGMSGAGSSGMGTTTLVAM